MSSTARTVVSPQDFPKFNGTRYKQWVDKAAPLFGVVGLLDVLEGRLLPPVGGITTRPTIPTGTMSTATVPVPIPPTSDDWSMYNAQLGEFKDNEKKQNEYDDKVQRVKSYLNICLSDGIWQRIKDMTPANAWTHLRDTYAVRQFI